MGFFTSILGNVIPALVGGIFGKRDNDNARQSQQTANYENRAWQVADRRNDRARYLRDRKNERQYAASTTARDRKYAGDLIRGERRYADQISTRDRANALADRAADMSAYKRDRSAMQAASDLRARRSARSRGIDFESLRDDAMKAGYNPLTALSFAQNYATDVNYQDVGGVYQPTSSIPGGSTVASGGGAMPSSPVAASGYSAPGGGYQSQPLPVFQSSAFMADALQGATQTFFNAVDERDQVRYETIANQVAQGQIAREVARQTPQQNFGFNLTKVKPYRPAVTYSNGTELDPVHGRPTDVAPVNDIPVTGLYDVGGGHKVRGLSQDVEWSELTQLGNEIWLGTRAVREHFPGPANYLKSRLKTRFQPGAPVPRGARTYMQTGSDPQLPLMGWGGI